MSRALLIGTPPPDLHFSYVSDPPFDAVVIGSLTLGQLLHFSDERVLSALAEGVAVYLYRPGLPTAPKNRALAASISSAQRELKSWGVQFTDGKQRHLITAEEALRLRRLGQQPPADRLLTPLAKEILER